MAVDLGIVAPHNTYALACDGDPMADYLKRKQRKSGADCSAAGWSFYPFLVPAYGRPHPDAAKLVSRLCSKAAREFVVESPKRLESNWWRNATSILMIGAASMVERCRPVPDVASGLDGSLEDMRGVEPHRPLRPCDLPAAPRARFALLHGASAPVEPS
jgi:hypothetical protein